MSEIYTRRVAARIKMADGTYGAPTWALVGDGPDGCEAIAKAPPVALKTAISAPRDGGNHRHFFALIRRVWENLPDGIVMTEDDLREQILILAGYSRTYVDLQGNVHVRAKSIKWSEMRDETKFKELKDACIKVIVTTIIPKMDSENNELAVMEML